MVKVLRTITPVGPFTVNLDCGDNLKDDNARWVFVLRTGLVKPLSKLRLKLDTQSPKTNTSHGEGLKDDNTRWAFYSKP